jgi:hypothetical protein
MPPIAKLIVFVLASAGAGYGLWTLAGETWAKKSEYVVSSRGSGVVGGDLQVVTIFVHRRSGDERDRVEVPRKAFDAAGVGDPLTIHVRRIPIVNGELLTLTIGPAAAPKYQWQEGASFFTVFLCVGAGVLGAVVTMLVALLAKIFKVGQGARD